MTKRRCTKQCSQLNTEDILSLQAETNCTNTEERIHFFWERIVVQLLITADIQCTDDNRSSTHTFQYLLISSELCLFIREIVFTLHVKELCTEQTNTFTTIVENTLNISWRTDITNEQYLMTICRNRWLILHSLQSFLLSSKLFSLLLIISDLLICRIQDHFTIDSIKNNSITCLCSLKNTIYAYNSRNLQRTSHNSTMTCTATDFCSKSLCKILVQGTCIRRSQILSYDNNRLIQCCKIRNFITCQIAQQTERNVLDICSSASHVFIIHGFEHRYHYLRNSICSKFCIYLIVIDLILDHRTEFRIIRHHQMSIKNSKLICLQALRSNFFDLLDVCNSLRKSSIQLLQFLSRLRILSLNVEYRCYKLINFCNSNTL